MENKDNKMKYNSMQEILEDLRGQIYGIPFFKMNEDDFNRLPLSEKISFTTFEQTRGSIARAAMQKIHEQKSWYSVHASEFFNSSAQYLSGLTPSDILRILTDINDILSSAGLSEKISINDIECISNSETGESSLHDMKDALLSLLIRRIGFPPSLLW